MPLLKVGNRVINTANITSVELHYEQRAFDPPDLEAEERESEPIVSDLVRIHFEGSVDSITFYHDEAKALRRYFTDAKNVSDIMSDDVRDARKDVGFG